MIFIQKKSNNRTTVVTIPLPVPLEEEFNLPGFSTKDENHEEKFARVDANKNKELTFDEFLHMELAYDGKISGKEYEEHYHGINSKSEALRSEYFGKVFEDFDEDFDMALNQDELEHVLAERFLVKPRENFPKLFYTFDHDHSGGLDLTEYMKFDANFPFDQTDPITISSPKKEKLPGQKITHPNRRNELTPKIAERADNAAVIMAQASQTLHKAPSTPVRPVSRIARIPAKAAAPQAFHGRIPVVQPINDFHPQMPGPTREIIPIVKKSVAFAKNN
uniref:EF-hand domain-containing protein n=1 Tax=Heterorhabditis bacteriophora TaxID=37862 RepID=A0A1I7W7D0_HETBA